MKTIMSKGEVRLKAGLTNSFPVGELEEILLVERDLFLGSYGLEKYEMIKSKIIDYSDSPVWVGSSVAGTVYLHEGVYWKAKTNSNAVPGGNKADWELPPKLNDECLEECYNMSLGYLIAFCVARDSVVPSSLKMSHNGVVIREGKDYHAAGGMEISQRVKDFDNKIARLWRLFKLDFSNCTGDKTNVKVRGSRYRAV